MQDDPYRRLAAAIVEQAALDYQEAMEYLYENPDGRKKVDSIVEKLEDEEFLGQSFLMWGEHVSALPG